MLLERIEQHQDDPLKQKPGADFMYTTWGYVLLGCVIEGATHEEFRSYFRRTILDPAGMTRTRDDDPAAIIPGRSRGYILVDGKLENSRAVDMSSKMAAGGWITTAPDMIRYLDAWMGGRFVGAGTRTLMLKPYVLPDHGGTVDGYGMGWFLDDYHGMRAGLHGGGTPQVSGIVFMVPEKTLSVAGFFNLEEVPGTERIALVEAIADIVLGYGTPNRSQFTPN
jgi:CubicO group peptidase (beta-lactamase class C family)